MKVSAALLLAAGLLIASTSVVRADEDATTVFGRNLKSAAVFRQNREAALQRFKDARKTYDQLNESISSTETSATERKSLETQALDKVKELVIRKIEAAQNHLQSVEERVVQTGDFTEAEKSTVSSIVAAYNKTAVEYKKQATEAETLAQVRAVYTKFKASTKDALVAVRKISFFLNVSQIPNIVEKLTKQSEQLKEHISAAAGAGNDVTEATEVFNGGSTGLAQAKQDYDAAILELKNVASLDLGKVTGLLGSARANLRFAHSSFATVLALLKDMYGAHPWPLRN